jgi:nucleoredoxin
MTMMRKLLVSVSCLAMGLMNLSAQNGANLAPANDNPLAGLNLDDSSDSASNSFASKFEDHLVVLDDGSLKAFDASTLKDVKYWAFYYSASWCPPCRAFTPKLVDFYNDFKKSHPNFELIFVNHDQSADDMEAYMKADSMPWPAVRFSAIRTTNLNALCGSGIPDLVLTDENGKVLSDSFHGDNYVGPYQVMDDIKKMVPKPAGT